MAWTIFTTEQMDTFSRRLFQPLILLVNYTLLQYLLVFYWARRHEPRVQMLFLTGALGVACLIPFADPDDELVGHLNDASESCCVLTFLLQITIIGHDLNKKIKFRTMMILTRLAELLIVADAAMILLSLTDIVNDRFLPDDIEQMLPNLCENVTLFYIFAFRYYYIVASRGWRDIQKNRKVEVAWYLLFATHELPFMALEDASGLSWENLQALWNRVTLAGCLWVTARTKLRNSSRYSHGQTASTAQRSAGATRLPRNGRVHAGGPKASTHASEFDQLSQLKTPVGTT